MLRQELRVAPRQGIEAGHALDERRNVSSFEQDAQISETSEPVEEARARQKGATIPARRFLGERRLTPTAPGELVFERADLGAEPTKIRLPLRLRGRSRFLGLRRPRRGRDAEKQGEHAGDAEGRLHLQTIGLGDAVPERSARRAAVASVMPGTRETEKGRDAKKTPRTRSGSSEQWSPLHTSRLSSKTEPVGTPSDACHETR